LVAKAKLEAAAMGADKVINADRVVYIVAEDPRERESLARLFAGEGFAVEIFHNVPSLFAGNSPDRAACLLIDLGLPEAWSEAPRQLTNLHIQAVQHLAMQSDLPAVVLSPHRSVASAVRAMQQGAVDYLEKPAPREALLAAVEAALARDHERRAATNRRLELLRLYQTLSAREAEVVQAILGGAPNREVAARLGIAARTVETHRSKAMAKLGARTIPDLVRIFMAIEAALASPDPLPLGGFGERIR
jgi:FixJ family two-component response regulator